MMRRISSVIFILAAVVLAGDQRANSQRAQNFDGFQLVDKDGNIRKPADYRDRYELLGTYTVIDPKGDILWGDGWGWALFKADAPDQQVATDYKKDCRGCHIPAKSTDWTYIQGYPVLKSQ